MFRRLCALAGMSALICSRDLPGQDLSLPRLVPAFTSSSIDASPVNRITQIRVGPQGMVLFVNNPSTATRLVLVDSVGKVVAHFGPAGAGPEEVQHPSPLTVTRDGLMISDPENNRFSEWDLRGRFKHLTLMTESVDLKDAVGSDLLAARPVGGVWRPVAVNRATGAVRELLLPSDTFITRHFPSGPGAKRVDFATTIGVWDDGFVAGDPNTYRIALYRWNGSLVRVLGRDLPPVRASPLRVDEFVRSWKRSMEGRGGTVGDVDMARMRDMAATQPVPSYMPGGSSRADSHHRLWVLGMEGDSAFADLFTAERFIGRLHLPCRMFNGIWSVAGTWLALACLPDDPSFNGDAVIKLFRIVDAGQ